MPNGWDIERGSSIDLEGPKGFLNWNSTHRAYTEPRAGCFCLADAFENSLRVSFPLLCLTSAIDEGWAFEAFEQVLN